MPNLPDDIIKCINNNDHDFLRDYIVSEHGKQEIQDFDSQGNTALHHWAKAPLNQVSELIFEALLATGIDISHQNNNGQTALDFAIVHAPLEKIQLILNQEPNVASMDSNRNNILHLAAEFSDPLTLEELIQSMDPTLLRRAVDHQNNQCETPLHCIARSKNHKFEKTQLLLNATARLYIVDSQGRGPLFWADLSAAKTALIYYEYYLSQYIPIEITPEILINKEDPTAAPPSQLRDALGAIRLREGSHTGENPTLEVIHSPPPSAPPSPGPPPLIDPDSTTSLVFSRPPPPQTSLLRNCLRFFQCCSG